MNLKKKTKLKESEKIIGGAVFNINSLNNDDNKILTATDQTDLPAVRPRQRNRHFNKSVDVSNQSK